MTEVIKIRSPSDGNGKDPNDTRNNPEYRAKLEEDVGKKPEPVLDMLKKLSATNRLKEMEDNLDNEIFLFEDLALVGQITLFYAKPNTGKTLLFLHFLIDGIQSERVSAEDIFYVNADDNYRGLFVKSLIAQKHGFYMISPAESGISPKDVLDILEDLARTDGIIGKVIILDTLKKFTDMMSKRAQADLYEVLRMLVTKGATVIIAGHANKHLDADGRLVYEGTSDTMNDIDCMYAIYRLSDLEDESQVVEFRREKDRGDNILKASYRYIKRRGMPYLDIVKSVSRLDDGDAEKAAANKYRTDMQTRYESERLFVISLLEEHGTMNQTQIIHELKGHEMSGEITGRGLRAALGKLTGIDWTTTRDKQAKNALFFELISSQADRYRAASGE